MHRATDRRTLVLLEDLLGLLQKAVHFQKHTRSECLVLVFVELLEGELLGLLIASEESEQEGELWDLQETGLGHPRVLVHGFRDEYEVDGSLLILEIFLLMTVTKHQHFQEVAERILFCG